MSWRDIDPYFELPPRLREYVEGLESVVELLEKRTPVFDDSLELADSLEGLANRINISDAYWPMEAATSLRGMDDLLSEMVFRARKVRPVSED